MWRAGRRHPSQPEGVIPPRLNGGLVDPGERNVSPGARAEPELCAGARFVGFPLAYRGLYEGAFKTAGQAVALSPRDPLVDRQASHTMAFTHFAGRALRRLLDLGGPDDRRVSG